MSKQIALNIGRELFRFDSLRHWVCSSQAYFLAARSTYDLPAAKIICIDQRGRICASGKEFREAQDSGAFPVIAYAIDPDFRGADSRPDEGEGAE